MRKTGVLKISQGKDELIKRKEIFRDIKGLNEAKGTVIVEDTIGYVTVILCLENNCIKVLKTASLLLLFYFA